MYAETDLMFPYFQNFSQEVQQLEDFWRSHKSNVIPMGNLVQTSTISEYDLGGEGDLFNAPEPIIEESEYDLGGEGDLFNAPEPIIEEPIIEEPDPMTAAMSMISCGEDVITPQTLKVAGTEAIQTEQLMSEVFYECKKDILAKEATETTLSDILDIKIPVAGTEENPISEGNFFAEESFEKSVSSECLSSMDWMNGAIMRPNFLDFAGMDLDAANGMRRAFSEGDIKTLGNGNVSLIHSSLGLPPLSGNSPTEDRRQKLSRYRNKKTKRNFGRKIKYACRKALADSQPRVRGRFAKTEEPDMLKNH